MATVITAPWLYTPDPTRGRPLFEGQLFVGDPDLDPEIPGNQKQLFVKQEDGAEVAVGQPFILGPGGVPVFQGSTVRLAVEGNYSLKILDRLGAQTYYVENVFEGQPVTFDQFNQLVTQYEFANKDDAKAGLTAGGAVVDLQPGMSAITQGYTAAGDEGQSLYLVEATQPVDNIFDHDLDNGNTLMLQPEETVRAKQGGAVADQATDNTSLIISLIDYCYQNGLNAEIESGVKWFETAIQNFASGSVTTTDPVTITNVATQGRNMLGAFVWNVTDGSFGICTAFTIDTVTVEELRLGTTNEFTAGDEYQISLMKVDVTIIDNSRFDPYSAAGAGTFTGQSKTFVNSNDPDKKSANELWSWGQYHPGFIAAVHEPGTTSGRASFLSRRYNENGKIQSFMQLGLNPVRPTDPVTNPGAAGDIIMAAGHNKGDPNEGATSRIMAGFRCSDTMDGQFVAIGNRAQDGITLYVMQNRNIDLKVQFNAKGVKRTHLEFLNDGVLGRTLYHWQSLSGFSGYNSIVQPRTSSLAVDVNLYSDATFTNEGAAGNVTLTFTDAPIGYTQELVVIEAFTLRAQTGGGDVFLDGTTLKTSSARGDVLKIKKVTATEWAIINQIGTWT